MRSSVPGKVGYRTWPELRSTITFGVWRHSQGCVASTTTSGGGQVLVFRPQMGVPRLLQDLSQYGERTCFGRHLPQADCQPIRKVVVDGPALVYWVYYRLLASRNVSLNILDAQPSYQEISAGVVTCLLELQREGVTVYALVGISALHF